MQTKTIQIKSFAEMLEFIEKTEITGQQLQTLLNKAYGIYITGKETKAEIITSLQSYYKNYGQQSEKPLFLD